MENDLSKTDPFPKENGPSYNIKGQTVRNFITWVCRIVFGATFIFSGFVKAVDPWGTYYKFSEYIEALGFSILPNLILAFVFALCTLEFLIGACIVTGSYRRSMPIIGCAFMAFMLPLTFWIAIKDPVADCGCFGDALIISNWATFWKNVALTAMIAWLIKFDRKTYALIRPALQWLLVVATLIYLGVILCYGYFKQPLIDYRAYQVGENLISDDEDTEPEFVFVYSKDGVKKEFGEEDDLPEENDGWEFVERKILSDAHEGINGKNEKNIRFWDISGDNDMTESILDGNERIIWVLMPDLASVSPATTWKINSLYDIAAEKGIEMVAVVAGESGLIKEWEDLSMPQYPIYTAEDTAIKEVARGNPAVLYTEKGVVKWKSTLSWLDVEELQNSNNWKELASDAIQGSQKARNISYIYMSIVAVLIALSFMRIITGGGRALPVRSSWLGKPAQQKTDEPSHD